MMMIAHKHSGVYTMFKLLLFLLCLSMFHDGHKKGISMVVNAQWSKPVFLNTLSFTASSSQVLTIPGGSGIYDTRYQYTTEMWIKPSSASLSSSVILSLKDGTSVLSLSSSKVVCSDPYNPTAWKVTSSVTISANTWIHIACTRSFTNVLTLYVNGISVGSYSSLTERVNAGVDIVIGCLASGSTYSNCYAGEIDEIRFFSKLRTQSEISSRKDSIIPDTESGLICYLKLDEPTGQTLVDSQTLTSSIPGYLGRTLSVESYDPVRTNKNPILQSTMSSYVWSVPDDGSPISFFLQIPELSPVRFSDPDGDTLYYSCIQSDGTALPGFLDYSDGGSSQTLMGMATNLDAGTYNLTIQCSDKIGVTLGWFQLTVNRVPRVAVPIPDQTAYVGSIFSFIVPAGTFVDSDLGQVLTFQAYETSKNVLPSWLSFNPSTKTFSGAPKSDDGGEWSIDVRATDNYSAWISNSFILKVVCPNYYTRCAFYWTHDFISSNNQVDIIANGLNLLSGRTEWSIEVWIHARRFSSSIIGKDSVGSPILALDSSGKMVFTTASGFGFTSSASLSLNTWCHVAFSKSSSSWAFYIDGVQSGAGSSSVPFGSISGNLLLGATGTSPYSSFFDGLLDDIRIWSVGRTSTDISTNRLLELKGSEVNLISYWKLNDGVGVQSIANSKSGGPIGYRGRTTSSESSDPNTRKYNYLPTTTTLFTDDSVTITIGTYSRTYNTFVDKDFDDFVITLIQQSGASAPGWLSLYSGARTITGTPGASDYGVVYQRLRANDGTENADIDWMTTVNRKPTVASIGNMVVNVDQQWSFTIPITTFVDPDNDVLTYSTSSLPGYLSFDAASRTFSCTHTSSYVGTSTITVTATDGYLSSSVSTSFQLTVNMVPVFNSIENQVCTSGISKSFTLPSSSFTNPDTTGTLSFSATMQDLSSLPSWITFNPSTRIFNFNAATANYGNYVIRVNCTDGYGWVYGDFTLFVNRPPVLTNPVSDVIVSNGDLLNLIVPDGQFTDPDGQTLTRTAKLSSGAALPSWLSFIGTTSKRFLGAPSETDAGTIIVRITCNDGYTTVYDDFMVKVNRKPVVSVPITGQYVNLGSSYSYRFPDRTFTDADGDSLTYTVTKVDGSMLPLWLSYSSKTFSGTPSTTDYGTIPIRIACSDGMSTVTHDFNLRVNRIPIVQRTIPKDHANTFYSYSYRVPSGIFSDPDGDVLVLSATQSPNTPLPSWLSFNTRTRKLSGLPVPEDAGLKTIRISATDGMGSIFTEFIIDVNRSPMYVNTIPSQWIIWGDSWHFDMASNTFLDPDGDKMTYRATLSDGNTLPGWISFNPITLVFSGPNPPGPGNTFIKVTADDSKSTGIAVFRLAVDRYPKVNMTIPNQIVSIDRSPLNYKIPPDTFYSLDLHTLYLSAAISPSTSLPSWLSFDTVSNVVSGSPPWSAAGIITLRVTATDTFLSNFTEFDILINRPPIVKSPISSKVITIGNSISIGVLTSDLFDDQDLDSLSTSIKLNTGASLPSWLTYSSDPIGLLSGSPGVGDYGTMIVRITTSDKKTTTNLDFSLLVNRRPRLKVPIPLQRPTISLPYTYTFPMNTFVDDDGDELTFFVSALPAWLSFNAMTRTFSGTPQSSDLQNFTVLLSAQDLDSNVTTSVGFRVNRMPVEQKSISSMFVTIPNFYSFLVPESTFLDKDGDLLTITAAVSSGSNLPDWLVFNGTHFFGTASLDSNAGILSIRLTASDGVSTGVSDFTLVVNRRPRLVTYVANTYMNSGALFSYQVSASTFVDDDGNELKYGSRLANGSSLPSWLSFDPTTLIYRASPIDSYAGLYNISLTANDSMSTTTTYFLVRVNRYPIVEKMIPQQVVTVEVDPLSFIIPLETFSDPDGDRLFLSALTKASTPLPAWLSFNSSTNTFSGSPTMVFAGIVTIRVTCTDSMASVFTDFNILVNRRPSTDKPIPNTVVTVDHEFLYSVPNNTFSDPDSNILTYSSTLTNGSSLPPWLSFSPADMSYFGAPKYSDAGRLMVKLIANDSHSISYTSFEIYINRRPIVLNSIANAFVTIGYSFWYAVPSNTFWSPDGNSLTYSTTLSNGSSIPNWIGFTESTVTYSGVPILADVANHTVRLIAFDGYSSNYCDFNLTVNRAPQVSNSIQNQIVNAEEFMNFQIPFNTFWDPDGNILGLSATLSPSGTLPSWMNFLPSNNTLNGTPSTSNFGSILLKITASDSMTSVATYMRILVNRKPTQNYPIYNQVVTIGYTFSLLIPSGMYSDEDGDSIVVTAAQKDGSVLPSWLKFYQSNLFFTGTPSQNDYGVLLVRLSASDGKGTTHTDFQLYVNRAPDVYKPIPTQTVTIGSDFLYRMDNKTFNDADSDELTYSATTNSGTPLPSWLFFDKATITFHGTPETTDHGELIVRVIAHDGFSTAQATFSLYVNRRPVVSNPLADSYANIGSPYFFSIPSDTFSDEDNQQLMLRAKQADGSNLPPWLSFNPASNSLLGFPSASNAGVLFLQILCSDGFAAVSTTLFIRVNRVPTIMNFIPAQWVNVGQPLHFELPSLTFADADNDTLFYSATLSDGSLLPSWMNFSGDKFYGAPSQSDARLLTVRVTASDSMATVSLDFTLLVNRRPVVAKPIGLQYVSVGDTWNFVIPNDTVIDPEGHSISYSADVVGDLLLPEWIIFDAVTRTFVGRPPEGSFGTISIRLGASDSMDVEYTSFLLLVNRKPVVQNPIQDKIIVAGNVFLFTVPDNTFLEMDKDQTLSYSSKLANGSALPLWLSFDAVSKTFSGTPSVSDRGLWEVQVVAEDNYSNQSCKFNLFVHRKPVVVHEIATKNAITDQLFLYQFPPDTFNDPDCP